MNQLFIGFTTEGTTDTRLLESILLRTFDEVALECKKQIEVNNPIIHVPKQTGLDFEDNLINIAKVALTHGVMVLCIHVDADDEDDTNVFQTKLNPSFEKIMTLDSQKFCKNLVPIVPVQMSEAWMLADKDLLKTEIGTDKSDNALGINKNPETYADPKAVIENAIRIAREDLTRRRRNDLKINELYQPIGQKISLEKLEHLPSYLKFKENVRQVYRDLKYLQ